MHVVSDYKMNQLKEIHDKKSMPLNTNQLISTNILRELHNFKGPSKVPRVLEK